MHQNLANGTPWTQPAPSQGNQQTRRCFRTSFFLAVLVALLLSACGGGDDGPLAERSQVSVNATTAGVTPLQATVDLRVDTVEWLSTITFTVATKAGGVAQPVRATYAADYLRRRGFINGSRVNLPLFGLYGGRQNQVTINLLFVDGSTRSLPMSYTAAAYVDRNDIYDKGVVRVRAASPNTLGFSYFAMKSALGPPVVVDIDGEIRWISPVNAPSATSIFVGNGFVVAAPPRGQTRLELDGAVIPLGDIQSTTYTAPHHNIERGKNGLLIEVDAEDAGVAKIESIVADVNASGAILGEWDFEKILTRHMLRAGDDPTALVRPGLDWFHMNSAIYDARDDSVIVSSRENFVIKVDYASGEIKWIFGDPTRYWYTVPSLRAKSLTMTGTGLYPSGQHALSIAPDGSLLLFDNGQPASIPPNGLGGVYRPYSSAVSFAIDEASQTAAEVWRFDYGQTIKSPFCSSAYAAADGSILITYATADNFQHARLVGLGPARNVVFDFEYESTPCATSWNSEIVAFESLAFR